MDLNRITAHIDLEALAHNVEQIRDKLPAHTKIMAVIKSDAYGHGAIQVAGALKAEGVNDYAVATIEEAKELRRHKITGNILILGYVFQSELHEAVANDITLTVFTYDDACAISKIAGAMNKTAKIHIKLDTGMGRIGFLPDDKSLDDCEKISKLGNIFIEGLFTHFAAADEKDKTSQKQQELIFNDFASKLAARGVRIPVLHCCNSAAIIDNNEDFYDMVRAGIMIYGLWPSDEVSHSGFDLSPVMSLISHISFIKTVGPGFKVSYGSDYVTDKKETVIATIPVGYGDGYPRLLSDKGRVIINGHYAPIIGRICMDQFMVDVTGIPMVSQGTEAVLMGRSGDKCISADEIAMYAQTINYEIVCDINKRVPRIYE